MSGGGKITGNSFLDMGVMVGASILAPQLAPEFLTMAEAEGGLGLSTAAASGITGAGLGAVGSGITYGMTGRDPLQGMLMGGIGGGIGGYGMGGGFSGLTGGAGGTESVTGLTTAPGGGITAAAPQVAGPQVAGSVIGSVEEPLASGLAYNAPASVAPEIGAQGAMAGSSATGGVAVNSAGLPIDSMGPAKGVVPGVPGADKGWWGSLNNYQKAATVGAGGIAASYLMNQDAKKYGIPASATTPYTGGNLSKFRYDPNQYTPDTVQPPNPVYQPNYAGYARPPGYADGGFLNPNSGNVDFMGGDMYPQSDIHKSQYAQSSQMPTSAQQVAASYEPETNPLTGEPIAKMSGGGSGLDALKDLMGSRDAIDKYKSQHTQNPKAVLAKAQDGDYNAMLALNAIKKTPGVNYASGGISSLGGYSDGGRMLKGPGDGMSDSIPATIRGKQPARLADNEFVVPADVVSHLGNGSSDAGAKKLYKMMDKVRRARTGKAKQAPAITADKYLPA